MNVKSFVLGLAAIAAVGLGTAYWLASSGDKSLPPAAATSSADRNVVKRNEVEPIQSVEQLGIEDTKLDGIDLPPAFFQKLPPSSRVPMTLPTGFKSGLPLPDGTFLPLLNGVPYAVAPARDASDGPIPPVVAKVTDQEGYEWYEHADGSMTTTRWTKTTVMGVEKMDVVTSHTIPVPDDKALTPGGVPPPKNPFSKN